MGCRGGESSRIENRAATEDQHHGPSADVLVVDRTGDCFKGGPAVLRGFASRNDDWWTSELDTGGMSLLPLVQRIDQVRPGFQKACIDHGADTDRFDAIGKNGGQDIIAIGEGVMSEAYPVGPRDREGTIHRFLAELLLKADVLIG